MLAIKLADLSGLMIRISMQAFVTALAMIILLGIVMVAAFMFLISKGH